MIISRIFDGWIDIKNDSARRPFAVTDTIIYQIHQYRQLSNRLCKRLRKWLFIKLYFSYWDLKYFLLLNIIWSVVISVELKVPGKCISVSKVMRVCEYGMSKLLLNGQYQKTLRQWSIKRKWVERRIYVILRKFGKNNLADGNFRKRWSRNLNSHWDWFDLTSMVVDSHRLWSQYRVWSQYDILRFKSKSIDV